MILPTVSGLTLRRGAQPSPSFFPPTSDNDTSSPFFSLERILNQPNLNHQMSAGFMIVKVTVGLLGQITLWIVKVGKVISGILLVKLVGGVELSNELEQTDAGSGMLPCYPGSYQPAKKYNYNVLYLILRSGSLAFDFNTCFQRLHIVYFTSTAITYYYTRLGVCKSQV